MNSFQVWIRPLREFCRVRIDGIKNAQWLLEHLSREFVFKTNEPMQKTAIRTVAVSSFPTTRRCHWPGSTG
jgi:hypothetical protein